MKKGFLIVLGFFALVIGISYLSTATKVATAPAEVISRTVDADNIIRNYEAFHDVAKNYDARRAQIREWSGYLKAEKNPDEITRLRTEVGAMRQSCRDLAARYNADSLKMNVSLFKDRGLPASLDATQCEG